jgi:hypothetical protein
MSIADFMAVETLHDGRCQRTAMLKLLRRFGFLSGSQRAHQVAHLTLKLV